MSTENNTCNLTINHRTGNLQTKGNITGNIANFDTINANTLNVTIPDEDSTVNSITAQSGNISNLQSDDFTSTANISSNSLTVQTGSIENLTTNTLTATTGNIENLTSNTFSSTSASVSSSIGCNSLTSQTADADNITANE